MVLGRGGSAANHEGMAAMDELKRLVGEIEAGPPAGQLTSLWKLVAVQLRRTPVDTMKAGKLVATRDLGALKAAMEGLASGAIVAKPRATGVNAGTPIATHPIVHAQPGGIAGIVEAMDPDAAPTPEIMKSALKAFRKRLKLTRLDEESKLGASPLTGGKKSSIMAIQPPSQFPRKVWDALVEAGDLKRDGMLYKLVKVDA
jgi:hypothetical protein